jgi:hypothetical protein
MKIFHFHDVSFRENGTKKKEEKKNVNMEMHFQRKVLYSLYNFIVHKSKTHHNAMPYIHVRRNLQVTMGTNMFKGTKNDVG